MKFEQRIEQACHDLAQLTIELRTNTPVHFVSIIRLDNTKRHFTGVSNDYEWVKIYLAERFYLIDVVFDPSYAIENPCNYWNIDQIVIHNDRIERFVELCQQYNHHSGLSLFNMVGDDLEVYTFVTSKTYDPGARFLLEHANYLKEYHLWLKEQIHRNGFLEDFLIEKPFYLPLEFSSFKYQSNFAKQNLAKTRRYFLGGIFQGNYLTQKEYHCLLHLRKHLTAKEIAFKMHVSPTTIQTYIRNIRAKASDAKILDILRNLSQ